MDWPTYRITGGPHSKNTVIEKDGERLKGLVGARVTFPRNGVVEIDLEAFVEHATLEVQGVAVVQCHLVGIEKQGEGEAAEWVRKPVAVGRGDDLRLALLDLLKQLDQG